MGAVVGVLCSQAMLESLGLSAGAATAGAVAIQWVLKDGIAEVGKLMFIKKYARSFDSHPKSWKAVGEVLSTVGSGLQLCTLLVSPSMFLALAATGNIAKATSYALWGATHMCFVRNFAMTSNVGDLTAKSEAQGAVALITGWLSGIILISHSHSVAFLFAAYFALAPLHYVATRNLLASAEFEILNETKATLIITEFIKTAHVPTMKELKPYERFFGEFVDDKKVKLPSIILGSTVEQAFSRASDLSRVMHALPGENYLIGINKGTIHVVLHHETEGRDALKALFNSLKYYALVKELVNEEGMKTLSNEANGVLMQRLRQSHRWTFKNFPAFVSKLDSLDWESESVLFNDAGYRARWKKAEKLVMVNDVDTV